MNMEEVPLVSFHTLFSLYSLTLCACSNAKWWSSKTHHQGLLGACSLTSAILVRRGINKHRVRASGNVGKWGRGDHRLVLDKDVKDVGWIFVLNFPHLRKWPYVVRVMWTVKNIASKSETSLSNSTLFLSGPAISCKPLFWSPAA